MQNEITKQIEMKKHNNFLFNLTFVLAILSTRLLLFNMLAILIWKKQIFFDRNTFSVVDIITQRKPIMK